MTKRIQAACLFAATCATCSPLLPHAPFPGRFVQARQMDYSAIVRSPTNPISDSCIR